MRDGAVPDELDLALVATLQAAPRADWQRVGHVLGVAGSTAARRWGRLTGASQLNFVVRLRSAGDIPRFQARLARELPALVITDQAFSLWTIKLAGHLLDFEGRHVRHVPIGRWPEEEAARAQATAVGRLRHGPAAR
jgi:hypothetical protein